MKAIRLKRFFVLLTALVAALAVAVFAAGVRGADGSLSASAEEEKPRITLSSSPVRLNKSDPYREFTVTIRADGVENFPGGLLTATVILTPADASMLDFVDFIESKDIEQSAILQGVDAYKPGQNVVIEAYSTNPVTEDFTVGGFIFKLKDSVTDIPDSITFYYEDNGFTDMTGEPLQLDSGSFTIEYANEEELEDVNDLSELRLTAGSSTLVSGTDAEQTVPTPIPYTDKGNLRLTATRVGASSSIKVTYLDSQGLIVTLVSERVEDLHGQSLGDLPFDERVLEITVTSEAGKSKVYTVELRVAQENVPQIVITSDIAQLTKGDAHREFTLTVKIAGVEKVQGGMMAASVTLTPDCASMLDFVGFIKSTDVDESQLLDGSEGIVAMEAMMNSVMATEDFTVGSFKFKLKDSVTDIPDAVTFIYEDSGATDATGDPIYLAGGAFVMKIASNPIEKPVLSGTEKTYNGNAQNFAPEGMAELVAENKVKLYAVSASGEETEVGIDAFSRIDAGQYEIVARPVDGYCWEGASSSAAQTYSFTINKAKINAISAEEGKLPLFTSDTYKDSLASVVKYKYYSDEACTQEVSPSDVEAGKSYYLKAVLEDGAEANFAFDEGEATQVYVSSGFAYTPKADGLSGGAIAGIVVGSVGGVGLLSFLIFFIIKKLKEDKGGSSRGGSSRGTRASSGHGSSRGSAGHGSSSHGSAGHGSSHGGAGHGTHRR